MSLANWRESARVFFVLGAVSALALSCGGGGSPRNVLSLVAPDSLVFTLVEESSLPYVSVKIRVDGDLTHLNGREVYVAIDDPAGLFLPVPAITVSSDQIVSLGLTGRRLELTAGRYTGRLTFSAYLDPELTEPMGNSVTLPYDVTVDPGLRLGQNLLDVQIPFGTAETVKMVSATPPDGGDLELEPTYQTDPWRPTMEVQEHALRVTIPAAPEGTHSFTYTVGSYYTVPSYEGGLGTTYYLTKDLIVRYTVTPNAAVDLVVTPPESTMQMTSSGAVFIRYGAVLGNAGIAITASSIEYLTHPAAANGNPAVERWLISNFSEGGVSGSCTWWMAEQSFDAGYVDSFGTFYFLPPGQYTARIRYDYTKDGAPQPPVYQPVTMTLSL